MSNLDELREKLKDGIAENRLKYALSSGLALFNKDDSVSRNIEEQFTEELLQLFSQYLEQETLKARIDELDHIEAYNDEAWHRDDTGMTLKVDERKEFLKELMK